MRRMPRANLDDLYDYLAEAGDVRWRAIVPNAMKPALTQVGTETQKPESPLNRSGANSRPAPK